jgi:hypothetical protein
MPRTDNPFRNSGAIRGGDVYEVVSNSAGLDGLVRQDAPTLNLQRMTSL